MKFKLGRFLKNVLNILVVRVIKSLFFSKTKKHKCKYKEKRRKRPFEKTRIFKPKKTIK